MGRASTIGRLIAGLAAAGAAWPAAGAPVAAVAHGADTYLNRPGADTDTLYREMAGCMDIIAALPEVTMAAIGEGLLDDVADGIRARANLENCMVVRGWRVVRLEKAEAERLGRLGRAELAQALGARVGLDAPPGTIVRAFGRGGLGPSKLSDVGAGVFTSVSLSLRVWDGSGPKALLTNPPKQKPPKERYAKQLQIAQAGPSPAGEATLMVRVKPGGGVIAFTRYRENGADLDDGRANLFYVTSPSSSRAAERSVAVSVPAGRWRVVAVSGVQTCLKAPSFEARAGDVLFLGTFDIQDGVSVDMDRAPIEALLKDASLKARLKLADWVNGSSQPCSGVYIEGFALDGVRAEDAAGD